MRDLIFFPVTLLSAITIFAVLISVFIERAERRRVLRHAGKRTRRAFRPVLIAGGKPEMIPAARVAIPLDDPITVATGDRPPAVRAS